MILPTVLIFEAPVGYATIFLEKELPLSVIFQSGQEFGDFILKEFCKIPHGKGEVEKTGKIPIRSKLIAVNGVNVTVCTFEQVIKLLHRIQHLQRVLTFKLPRQDRRASDVAKVNIVFEREIFIVFLQLRTGRNIQWNHKCER